MKLSIPANVIAANRDVLGDLQQAAARTLFMQATIEREQKIPAGAKAMLTEALDYATQARDGVANLGQANLLDGTFQRYANHSVRELTKAVAMLERAGSLSKDGMSILQKTLFDAEVSTRLGSMAGVRSLEKPSHKAIERATDFGTDGSSGSSSSGPVWVDGEWLDGLGNPVRGGGGDNGPDGTGSGWDGMGDRTDGGGWVGPDGEGYSGI